MATLSSSWKLLAFGPNGAAAISDNGRWYVVRPDGTHTDIGAAWDNSSPAWVKFAGDQLVAGVGNTVFEVNY